MIEFIRSNGIYVFLIIGLLVGIPVVWHYRERTGIKSNIGVILLCLLYSICSMIAAMVFADIEGWISHSTGGRISTYGIYLIGPFLLIIFSKLFKLNTYGVLDLFALYAMPSMFLMRCDCLISGCCGGLPIFDTGLTWPTRESEMIFYIVMFFILWKKLKENEIPGQLLPLLMVCYGCFRFINQWFRDTGTVGLHMSHFWSLLCLFVGLGLLLEFRQQAKEKRRKMRK